MTAMWLTKNTLLWYAVTGTALVLVTGALAALGGGVGVRRSLRTVLPAGFVLLAGFALFLLLMDCARYAYLAEPDPRYRPFQIRLFERPWGLYAGLEAVLGLLLFLVFRNNLRYRRTHLTPDAIRETVDVLPEGICISAPDGTILLSNLQIRSICRALTGSVLSDAARFRKILEETGEEQKDGTLIRTPEGKVWRLSRGKLTENGQEYDQITAADITERYRVTEELREKNGRLLDFQRRMKEVSDLSGDMFIAREEANARAALHNQLGQVLLMGRHYLEHPESTDPDMVRTATREMNRFLLREAEESPRTGTDLLRQALDMVRGIGIKADLHGMPPADPVQRAVLAHAVQECAANTVKHAEGSRIDVTVTGTVIRITNDGRPPEGPVTESGGLLSLRRSVEEAGGRMTLESRPAFSLTIRFPEAE